MLAKMELNIVVSLSHQWLVGDAALLLGEQIPAFGFGEGVDESGGEKREQSASGEEASDSHHPPPRGGGGGGGVVGQQLAADGAGGMLFAVEIDVDLGGFEPLDLLLGEDDGAREVVVVVKFKNFDDGSILSLSGWSMQMANCRIRNVVVTFAFQLSGVRVKIASGLSRALTTGGGHFIAPVQPGSERI